MRVERIEIDGFGRFHDASWSLREGLTVLLGANEAGKTTLLNALRALLFGFEATRDGRTWYPATAGGRRGGRLVLRTAADERWTVERHGERGGSGALAVRAPNGNQGGQETLDRLLHGADRDLFTSIFAFGLGELQTFASLSAEGVRGRIYGAGAGMGGTSAVDLERGLRQRMDAVFLPRGSQRPLNRLLARIEELRAEVADLGRQPAEHAALHAERDALLSRSAALADGARAARERSLRLRHLREARPVAVDLAEIDRALAVDDPGTDALPEDAVSVLDRRIGEEERARAILATLDEELGEARSARDGIVTDPDVLAAASEIRALVEERAHRSASASRRHDLSAAIARDAAVIDEQRARAGDWDEARLVAVDDSIPAIEETRRHEAALAAATDARVEAERRLDHARDELAAAAPDGADPAPAGDGPDADIGTRLAAYRQLVTSPRGDEASASGPGPLRIAVAAGTVGVGAVAGMVSGAELAGVVAGLAVGAVVVAMGTHAGRVPRGGDGERASRLATLGLPEDAGHADVLAAGEALVAAQARAQASAAVGDLVRQRHRDVERRAADLARAREAEAAARESWASWLRDRDLGTDLSPDAARALMAAAGTARRAVASRDHHRRELAAMDRDDATYRRRVDRLLERVGFELPEDDVRREARLAGLAERLDHATADARRAADLDERIARQEERRAAAAGTLETGHRAVTEHLATLGCPDPESLRRRAAASDRRRALETTRRELVARMAGIAGGHDRVPALVAELEAVDPAAAEVAEHEAAAELERIEAEGREAATRAGAVEARIVELEAAEEIGARRQELAVLEGRAAALAREWATQALALRLLETTRARYERERQPDVVRAAEDHFERITGGRYPRIVAPPGAGTVRVETEGGESRGTEELSRGTAEQLYLALRFGLIEEFARHAEPLPVVMDDILVNFDPDRAARAAAAIAGLAGRHQVLYFTCHAWTAELLDPGGARTIALG